MIADILAGHPAKRALDVLYATALAAEQNGQDKERIWRDFEAAAAPHREALRATELDLLARYPDDPYWIGWGFL